MSNWAVSDWLTYVPFILGALLLAVIQGAKDMTAAPSWLPSMFSSTNWNYVPLALMLIGALFFGLRQVGFIENKSSASPSSSPSSSPAVSNARLQLHMYGDQRTPSRISATGIWRWFYLRTLLNTIDKETGEQKTVGEVPILFITFDPPVNVGTLEVSSPDLKLPLFEVKEFNNRFAIITFMSTLAGGDLEVNVHP